MSGNKDEVLTFGSSMVSHILQPVESSLGACAVENVLRLFGQLTKAPLSQNKIVEAAQTLFFML